MRLAGHRYRQDDDTWTKKIMNFRVEGPSARGRPKLRWSDVVNKDLQTKGLKIEMAENRQQWRDAIKPKFNVTD